MKVLNDLTCLISNEKKILPSIMIENPWNNHLHQSINFLKKNGSKAARHSSSNKTAESI